MVFSNIIVLEGNKMKSIVIIGNGFDLGHDLPTRIYDFIQSNCKFQEKYQIFKGINWNDLELNYKYLLFDVMTNRTGVSIEDEFSEILGVYGHDEYGFIDYVPFSSDMYIDEINKLESLITLLTDFEKDFSVYLQKNCNKIKLQSINPRREISQILKSSSFIINFNYTQVIEEVYQIKHVNHIHGSLIEDNIAIGTDAIDELKESLVDFTYPTELPCKDKYDLQARMTYYVEDMDGDLHEDNSIKSLFYKIGHNIKQNELQLFELIDKKNKETLSSRQNIKNKLKNKEYDTVFILGHSLGEADMSVFQHINRDAKIYCYYHENMGDYYFQQMKDNLSKLGNYFELVPNNDLYSI